MPNTPIVENAISLYNRIADDSVADGGVVYFRGHPSKIAQNPPPKGLGFAAPTYNRVKGALVAMGCIQIVQRGGNARNSIWILNHPPEEGLWETIKMTTDGPVVRPGPTRSVQELSNLRGRVTKLEEQFNVLAHEHFRLRKTVAAFMDLEGFDESAPDTVADAENQSTAEAREQ